MKVRVRADVSDYLSTMESAASDDLLRAFRRDRNVTLLLVAVATLANLAGLILRATA